MRPSGPGHHLLYQREMAFCFVPLTALFVGSPSRLLSISPSAAPHSDGPGPSPLLVNVDTPSGAQPGPWLTPFSLPVLALLRSCPPRPHLSLLPSPSRSINSWCLGGACDSQLVCVVGGGSQGTRMQAQVTWVLT